ncbi:ABC transporter ATP-binding protein [Flavobacterium sp.]|jgi:ABC-type polysaccharide/polyol phosphate transport system ATPase subunit|uniref:ABC transporter ATP-binding protein n=1 Tax=Flavobacterium sp. TaxID=239 RepID=UPI0037C116A8
MAQIKFQNVTLRYPIYGSHGMSLRSHLMRVATGGRIEQDARTTVVTALKDVSFTLNVGDAVGLVGHNGSGKSTLLRTMAGIYPPSKGRVILKGKVATVFELGAGMDYELSGYENIIHLGMMMGLSYSEAKALTPDIEKFTELGDFLRLPVRTYSSGMTMRLMFAVATAMTPEILLLDEMFSTGDAEFKEKSVARINNIINSAKIFVFASHDYQLLKTYCNRVFRLEHGHLEEVSIETFA